MAQTLSKFFTGIGAKRLSAVEVEPHTSNQHEFNGISTLKQIFGEEKTLFDGVFIYLCDEQDAVFDEQATLTWYDAREQHPTRSEHRLYYSSNAIIDKSKPDDLVVIAITPENRLAVIVASSGSTSEQQLLWLFGLDEVGQRFIVKNIESDDIQLGYAGKFILRSLGIDEPEDSAEILDSLLREFGGSFPKTRVFSNYARSLVAPFTQNDDPDAKLLSWMDKEEELFRTLEKHLVAEKLQLGFGEGGKDVDAFISFSLSVQNRRKSRAGAAFENHLAALFSSIGLDFSWGAKTERNNKPDFIFPSIERYLDKEFQTELLTMLGVKTTAKDRWRQVLTEADRLPEKHLVTLEPAISPNQTNEMKTNGLKLVLPQPLHDTYKPEQRKELLSIADFTDIVLRKQSKR